MSAISKFSVIILLLLGQGFLATPQHVSAQESSNVDPLNSSLIDTYEEIPTGAELIAEFGLDDEDPLPDLIEENPYTKEPLESLTNTTNPKVTEPLRDARLARVTRANDLPVKIYLDDVLISETVGSSGLSDPNVYEPEITTSVMDIHLNVNSESVQRRVSVELERQPILVSETGNGEVYSQIENLNFKANWNYGAFISRGEIRLYRKGSNPNGKPLKVLALNRQGSVSWNLRTEQTNRIQYALRVYGKNGGFDQSSLTDLNSSGLESSDGLAINADQNGDLSLSAYDAPLNNTGFHQTGIELYGAQIKFQVNRVPANHRVLVMGQEIAVLGSTSTADLIFPPGNHKVQISVVDGNGRGMTFERSAFVPKNDVFYAALGDITIGANTGKSYLDYYQKPGEAEDIDLFESVGVHGQGSLFLKGRVLGKYLITAALDTGEGKLDTLFDNIVTRDPNSVLSKINPDETYSVYGDYSTINNEAPTQEKLFVKIERNGSHLLWGAFKTAYRGNTFATIERSLYGAEVKFSKTFQSENMSTHLEASGFAIPPGQIQQRDQLRGNNGFVYSLSNSNILPNSEIIRVEVRHPITGLVVEETDFNYGIDYDIDYLQGQVVLASSLPSSRGLGGLITGSYPVYLVVLYEFSPEEAAANQFVFGGRTELTVGDYLSVGATGLIDGSGPVNQTMIGADAQINIGKNSFLKAQIANTKTLANDSMTSQAEILTRGSSNGQTSTNTELNSAIGWKVEAGLNLEDLGIDSPGSIVTVSAEHRDKNFAAPGQGTLEERNAYLAQAFVPLLDGKLRFDGELSSTEDITNDIVYRSARLDVGYDVTDKITLSTGVEHVSESDVGKRTDVGAGVAYRVTDKLQVGGFASTTVKASPSTLKRNRFGVEMVYRPTESIDIQGAVATGTFGLDAKIEAGFSIDPSQRTYVSYEIGKDPGEMFTLNPTDSSQKGLLKIGSQYDRGQTLKFYTEGALKHQSSDILSYSHTGGMSYIPNDAWQFGLDGRIIVGENLEGETAVESMNGTVSANYVGDKLSAGSSATFTRSWDFATQDNNDKFETSSFARIDYDPNWKLYASLNTVFINNQNSSDNANYINADISAAYRPVDNNRFSSVFSYKALYDLPSNGSDSNVSNVAYKQRSHILSADASYAFTPYFTLSGKYGLKWGQVTSNRNADDWKSSTVHLVSSRADFNFAKKWDAVFEGRLMHISEGNSTRYGALAAIYRHFGKNLKIGVGHSFSSVSDDLTNVDAVSDGFFINVVTKF
ncbi:MAG: hypothetical protein ACPGVN_05260 [Alphaproteobacteria bacterium]